MLRALADIADLLAAAGVIESLIWACRAESKPKGRFLPSTVEMIDRLQQPGQVPEGPHL